MKLQPFNAAGWYIYAFEPTGSVVCDEMDCINVSKSIARTNLTWAWIYISGCDLISAVVPSLPRPGVRTCLCLRLHRWHVRGGLPASVCLLLLPPLPDVSGTDHQGVVLVPPTLQPWTPGQSASLSGPSLVPLLALPTHPVTSAWRWDKLPAHRIAGTHPVTAERLNINRPCVFTFVVMVNVIGSRSSRERSPQEEVAWDGKKPEQCVVV